MVHCSDHLLQHQGMHFSAAIWVANRQLTVSPSQSTFNPHKQWKLEPSSLALTRENWPLKDHLGFRACKV